MCRWSPSPKAEQILGVSRVTLYRWMHDGFINGEQLTPGGPWHIRITDELRRRIVPEVPDGWVRLDQASKILGVARQTVLHKVQRGELQAVHVNQGRRKGLRINVNGADLDCSTQPDERKAQCQPRPAGPTRQRFSLARTHSREARAAS